MAKKTQKRLNDIEHPTLAGIASEKILLNLSHTDRAIIILHVFLEYNITEIGWILGYTPYTVAKRYTEIIRQLRDELKI